MSGTSSGYLRQNFFNTISDPDGVPITDITSFNAGGLRQYLVGKIVTTHHVNSITAGLPDLISYVEYGSEQYWWLICLVNGVVDPINEIAAGMNLIIPTKADLDAFIKKVQTPTNATKTTNRIQL